MWGLDKLHNDELVSNKTSSSVGVASTSRSDGGRSEGMSSSCEAMESKAISVEVSPIPSVHQFAEQVAQTFVISFALFSGERDCERKLEQCCGCCRDEQGIASDGQHL